MARSSASQLREDSARPGAAAGPSGAGGELAEEADEGHRQGLLLADKYELASVIGEGGMGTVWRARNVMLDADVAVKLIRREIRDPSILERFIREARASARLQHPSIVRVYDYGTSSKGEPFMVMELLQGTNLGHRLDQETRLEPVEAVTLLLPIAAALAVAHDAGVVHRDLKPENIFLVEGSDGCARPVIMDFGIAKLKQAPTDRPLTGQDALVGTPEYMSPEQLSADADIDARTDVWGFCVLLHEVISGQRPFEAGSARELFAAIVTATPPSLQELGFADERLSEIVRRGLAKAREDRWSSMRELGGALAQWAADAGMATDAAGVTLERWSGVALPPRRARASDPPCAGDRTPPATSVRSGSVPPLLATNPPPKPRSFFSTGVLAAMLGVVGLVLGGWATRPRPTEGASPARQAQSAHAAVSIAAAANLPSLPAALPRMAIAQPTPLEVRAVSAPRSEGPAPSSATPRPEATRVSAADAAAAQPAAPASSAAPTAAASVLPPPPAQPKPRAPLPASRVPATPNF